MKQFAESNPDLGLEERNLLSVAYKNVVGARRASLRIIGSIQNKEEGKGESEKVALISGYKTKVETELTLTLILTLALTLTLTLTLPLPLTLTPTLTLTITKVETELNTICMDILG